jgi:hypothetical protein
VAVVVGEELSPCLGSAKFKGRATAASEEGAGRPISRPRRWLTGLLQRIWWNPAVQPWTVRMFAALQWLGISVCPNHYYWPIPDLAELKSEKWPVARPMPGVELNLDRQREFAEMVAAYSRECTFASAPGTRGYEYH